MTQTHNNPLRSMVISAVMAALALVLPMVFHATGLGSHFLPMLLPLLLNAFLSSPGWAVLTGALVPWISAFATGMPPLYPPIALVMSIEGAVMALVASTLYRNTPTLRLRRKGGAPIPSGRLPRNGGAPIWPALIAGVLADRIISFTLMLALSSRFGLPARTVAIGAFLHSLPGVCLQLAVIPLVLKTLSQRRSVLFGYDD